MNTLNDTLATLNEDARDLTRAILESARKNFEDDGRLLPMAFYLPAQGKPVIVTFDRIDDETKPRCWDLIRQFRETHPVVLFLTEAWMVRAKDKKPLDFLNPDGTCKIMPRDHPDREENVTVNLWAGPRTITFMAGITRNPTALGPWDTLYDSDFPKSHAATKVEGALMDGGHFPSQAN